MDRIARIHASSGTTGKPTVVGYTRSDLATWGGLVARSIRAAGGRPGMKVHIAYGYGLFTGGLGAHYGAEAAGCTVIPMSGGQTEKQVQLIRDFAPDIIMVTPSYMLAILDEFRRQDIDPRSTQSGRPMGEGESGELVFTSLTKEALPVIRYRTGDLTRLLPGSIAAMRRVAKIVGRADDMLIIRGVNVFPSQIEELILRCQGLAPHYEIEITRPNRMDEMRILVEARPELAGHSHSAEASLLAGKVKDIVGISAEIFVVASGSLRRSSGKAVHVNDRR
jgi:phenylacetate-coenzyme A ligase PaaK-like adenylate-forming protein